MSVPKKQKPYPVKDTLYHGVCTEARAPLLYSLAQGNDTEMTVALVADPRRAQELAVELETYTALVKVKMPHRPISTRNAVQTASAIVSLC